MKKILIGALFLTTISAFAYPSGTPNIGTTSKDGAYVLPFCGSFSLSKETQLDGCDSHGDFYQLSPVLKITYFLKADYLLPKDNDSTDSIGNGMVPYSYEDRRFVFSNLSYGILDDENRDEILGNNRNVSLELVDLREEFLTETSDGMRVRDETIFKIEEVNTCWQVLLYKNEIMAICSDVDTVYLVKQSMSGQSKTKLFTAREAGVKLAYLLIPNLKLDTKTQTWRNDQKQENLGNESFTYPKGYIDLKTRNYVFSK